MRENQLEGGEKEKNEYGKIWIDALGREYSACVWLLFSITVAVIVYYITNPSIINLLIMFGGIFIALERYWRITRNYRELIYLLISHKVKSIHEEPCLLFGRVKRRKLIVVGIIILLALSIFVIFLMK